MDNFDFYWHLGSFYLVRDDEKLPWWVRKYCPESDDRMEFLVDRDTKEVKIKVTYLEYDDEGKVHEVGTLIHDLTEAEQVDVRSILFS